MPNRIAIIREVTFLSVRMNECNTVYLVISAARNFGSFGPKRG